MPVGVEIFFVMLCISAYLVIGLFGDMTIQTCLQYENPLWKLPIITLWPFAMLYLIGWHIYQWVQSVIDYYNDKQKKEN